MNNISSRLRHLVEVWHTLAILNELGEQDKEPKLLKNAYCDIVPLSSTIKQGQADTESNDHQFKFIFRKKSIPDIKKDWFFLYEGKKYEVLYFNKDFKDSQFIEVFCKRLEE